MPALDVGLIGSIVYKGPVKGHRNCALDKPMGLSSAQFRFLLTEVVWWLFSTQGFRPTPYSFVFRVLSFSRMKLRISSAIAKSLIHCSL